MADTLKEIYRGTFSFADILTTGAKTLLTTDANTQYVIKDVDVSTSVGTAPVLAVNDYPIVSASNSSSGSAIVDVNSSIKYVAYKVPPTLLTRKMSVYTNNNSTLRTSTNTYADGVKLSATTDNETSVVGSTTTSGNSNLAFNAAGDMFYTSMDGNSQTSFYRKIGGINANEAVIFSGSYLWIVFDGVSKYYYTKGNDSYLYTYNIETKVETSRYTGGNILSNSSYPSAFYMNNGKILINWSGNGQTTSLWILDPLVGGVSTVSVNNVSVSGTSYKISGYYNSDTDAYTFYKRFGTNLYVTRLTNGISTFLNFVIPQVNAAFIGYMYNTDTTYTWAEHIASGGKTKLFTMNTLNGDITSVDWLPYETTSGMVVDAASTASPSVITATASLRITGVQSTI